MSHFVSVQLFRMLFVPSLVPFLSFLGVMTSGENEDGAVYYPSVMICILVRNKAHTLPYFLGQLEELDYPKYRLHLHIRSDHNVDSTLSVLDSWTRSVAGFYGSIDYRSDLISIDKYEGEAGPFDWTEERYQRIIYLKEDALSIARAGNFDYLFFLDGDNFLTYPRILQRLMATKKSVIAPMLRSTSLYSNFWAGMNERGYYVRTGNYEPIYQRELQGLLPVPMIHSTVLIDLNDPKTTLLTFDRTKLIDPVPVKTSEPPLDDVLIFARSAKIAGLEFYLLNTFDFGYLLPPNDPYEVLEADVENMRYLLLESLFHGPPGLLYSPLLDPTAYIKPNALEPGNYFDQVYLVNLRRRPDRRSRMEWCLRVLGIKGKVMEAVDGTMLNDSYVYDQMGIRMMPEYRDPYHKRTMTRGEIGCFLSHYRIWQDIAEHKYKRVLVFEDDLRFVNYFRPTLAALMDEADEKITNWDLIYLGRKRLNPEEDGPMVSGCRHLSYVGYSYWTLSYALTYAGAVKLLEGRPLDKLVPVDEYLPIMFDRHPESSWKSHFENRNLVAFTAEPLLVYPTHYTGQPGYISDTENAPLANTTQAPGAPNSGTPLESDTAKWTLRGDQVKSKEEL